MEMGQTPFRDISKIKTASIGVTRITPNAANYKAALEPATHIEERLKKSGVRNFIAVAAERRKQVAPNPLSINDLSKLAVHCRFLGHVRQNAMVPILIQVIYSLLDGADAVAIPQKLQDLKSRFQISIQHNLIASEPAITCELTPQEWATAVIFSLLKRFADGKGPIEALDELTLAARSKKLFLDVVRVHDEATHSIELCALLDEQPDITAKIGRGWVPMSVNVPGAVSIWAPNSSTEDTSASPVVLMPIGDDALQAARQFEGAVAGIVAVDDRPVTGGGLPDFWQSNIARVIHAALRNPNVRHILVIGDAERAHRTVDYLRKSQDDWRLSAATLPEKLAISHARITEFIDRNLDIKISTTDEIAHTLCNMYSSLTESVSIKGQPTDLERASQARRILTASQLPNDERLFHRDGLRAKTLADAYPRVIHILRSETQEPNQPELAGRQFRELTGFKLVLENPFVDEVPHYWSSEQTDFHTYYDIQFCKPNEGTFGPRLLKERPIQAGTNLSVRASALDQVERAIRDHRATRRVMLSVAEAEDLGKPLGLAHIQILPRYIAQQWRLDFLWVWRTVEALVGLPFSAYGSVRWSMAFLEDLKARLGGTLPLESGNLTYVAMSLHMYLDDGDKEIARTIVQHASI